MSLSVIQRAKRPRRQHPAANMIVATPLTMRLILSRVLQGLLRTADCDADCGAREDCLSETESGITDYAYAFA